jgi:hypothetical protein
MKIDSAHLLMAAFGFASIAVAQSKGVFTPAGSMVTPRFGHTATLLPRGIVLIAGGMTVDYFSPTATAELYDPLTGTFTATGSMSGPRYEHTATLLPDGRVLIAGGGDATGHLSLTAELYDPATGTFTRTGGMAAGHWGAILLHNGKVLMGPAVFGGLAELYDPSNGTFAATGSYADPTVAFFWPTMTSLADGRVMIPADSPPEIYYPATGSFSPTGAMVYPHAHFGVPATLLANGNVLFAGGEIDNEYNIGGDPAYPDGVYPYGEIYDPSAGSFAATGNLIEPRWAHTATLLPDGTTLIVGGAGRSVLQSAELYDASRRTFRATGNLLAARRFHSATLLRDSRVLITGGIAQYGPPPVQPTSLASAEIYTPVLSIPPPALFSLSGDGRGQGAIWHATTGALVSEANPAVTGEILSMYTTSLAGGGVIPPQVAIGGRLAEILFFGGAPGYSGYNQVNFRLPSGVAPGPAVPVRLTYLSRPSNEVTISVQ